MSAGCTNEMEKLEPSDSKITLYITLKNASTRKLRLRIWDYSLGGYLYILVRDGLTLQHKTYSLLQEEDNFFE